MGLASVHFEDRKTGASSDRSIVLLAPVEENSVTPVDWADAERIDLDPDTLGTEPAEDSSYAELPAEAGKASHYRGWEKALDDWLYREERLQILLHPGLEIASEPGESERAFRIRLRDAGREERDRQIEDLREKYEKKLRTAAERVRKAEQKVEREEEQASAQRMNTYMNIGTTVLTALLGRKKVSRSTMGRASSTIRTMSRSTKEKQDVERALEDLSAREEDLQELEQELEQEVDALKERLDPDLVALETLEIKPRRQDVDVQLVALAWVPA